MKKVYLVMYSTLLLAFACKEPKEKTTPSAELSKEESKVSFQNVIGAYVDAAYFKKDEGYDWVAIKVDTTSYKNYALQVSIRSRNAIKKPTCTLDGFATALNDSTFEIKKDVGTLRLQFNEDKLSILKDSDEAALFYYCSGGASLAGLYTKLQQSLDTTQIDQRSFVQNLRYDTLFFEVSGSISDRKKTVCIKPTGLELKNQEVQMAYEGNIVDAQITDLNQDDSPEILLFIKSAKDHSISVKGVSVNNRKSMSLFAFPDGFSDSLLTQSYKGYDQYEIKNDTVLRTFPEYQNGTPSGATYTLKYTLIDGEAMRSFKMVDFAKD